MSGRSPRRDPSKPGTASPAQAFTASMDGPAPNRPRTGRSGTSRRSTRRVGTPRGPTDGPGRSVLAGSRVELRQGPTATSRAGELTSPPGQSVPPTPKSPRYHPLAGSKKASSSRPSARPRGCGSPWGHTDRVKALDRRRFVIPADPARRRQSTTSLLGSLVAVREGLALPASPGGRMTPVCFPRGPRWRSLPPARHLRPNFDGRVLDLAELSSRVLGLCHFAAPSVTGVSAPHRGAPIVWRRRRSAYYRSAALSYPAGLH